MRKWCYVAVGVALFSAPFIIPQSILPSRALELHRNSLVFDAHVHMINRQFYGGGDIGYKFANGQVDLPRAREGGMDAMFFTLFVEEQYYPGRHETRHLLRLLDLAQRQIGANSDKVEPVYRSSDIQRIVGAGKIAALLDVEGGFDLDGDLAVLRQLHKLGVRSMQLSAHNWANSFAESCCAEGSVKGLTQHGLAVVREMNRLGIIINISHASDAAIDQVLDASSDPVMATHHGLRSFNDIPRTMSDTLLRKLASKGGVIGFHLGCEFHSRKFFDYRTAKQRRAFWDTRHIGDRERELPIFEIDKIVAKHHPAEGIAAPDDIKLTPEEWLAPVERAIELVGEDHVALGSDLDGGPTLPRGMRDARDLPRLTEAMLKRGWTEQRIRKFLGENVLRVVTAVLEK